jgi:hypothetical protein
LAAPMPAAECYRIILNRRVPNTSLDEMVRERARKVAAERLSRIDHSMRLEDQGVPAGTLEEERERLAEELLRHPRRLWDRP